MMKTDFKWRFTASYNDGSSLVQPANDVSCDGLRSSYADVQHDKLHIFTLNNGSNFFSLNLSNGEFASNAGRFKLHVGELHNVQLLYFRRVTAELHNGEPRHYSLQYNLGFTALNAQGEPVQHSILLQ